MDLYLNVPISSILNTGSYSAKSYNNSIDVDTRISNSTTLDLLSFTQKLKQNKFNLQMLDS
jgi:hypothetical protein